MAGLQPGPLVGAASQEHCGLLSRPRPSLAGRLGDLAHIQRIHARQTIETADLERQAFIAQLAANGPNHPAYLEYLVDPNYQPKTRPTSS